MIQAAGSRTSPLEDDRGNGERGGNNGEIDQAADKKKMVKKEIDRG